MKHLITFFILINGFVGLAQWTEIGTGNAGGGYGHAVVHNNKLFVTTALRGLMVSTNQGETFTDITTDTLGANLNLLISAGERLYVFGYVPTRQEGYAWYSLDDGQSWTLDNQGLPTNANPIYLFAYDNGTKIAGQFQGNDQYFHRDLSSDEWVKIPDFDNNNNDPLYMVAEADTLFAITPLDVQYSTDGAENWFTLTKTGLPNYFNVHGFDVENGRIYALTKVFGQKMKLHYLDPQQTQWDTLQIGEYVSKTLFNQDQTGVYLKAQGNTVWMSLQNNAANTRMDFLRSNDMGNTWAYDTLGFNNDPNGTNAVRNLILDPPNGYMYATTGTGPLYRTSNTVNITEQEIENFRLYPNPTSSILHISANNKNPFVATVFDSSGKVMFKSNTKRDKIQVPVSSLAPGVYFVSIKTDFHQYSYKVQIN